MTALSGVRRTRTTIMLATSLAMLMLLAGFGYAGYKALRRYEGAKKVDDASAVIPDATVAMLATVDDANVLTSLTLLVSGADGAPGGSMVTVPVVADTSLGFGDERLPFTEVYAAGGLDELRTAVENSLSITLDLWQAAAPAEVEALLAPVGDIPVQLPVAAGESFPAGPATLTPGQAVQVLNYRAEGVSDRQRRPNVAAVWAGIAAAATAQAAAAPAGTVPTTAIDASAPSTTALVPPTTTAEVLADMFAGTVNARELMADVYSAEMNPTGKDVEGLVRTDAVMVLATIAPRSMSTPASGLTFMIQTVPGSEARVQDMIALVLFTGGNVKWVKFDGPVIETSRMLFKQDSIRQQAEASGITSSEGLYEYGDSDLAYEDIDVIIQLGSDFLLSTDLPEVTTTTVAGGAATTTPTSGSAPPGSTAGSAPATTG